MNAINEYWFIRCKGAKGLPKIALGKIASNIKPQDGITVINGFPITTMFFESHKEMNEVINAYCLKKETESFELKKEIAALKASKKRHKQGNEK